MHSWCWNRHGRVELGNTPPSIYGTSIGKHQCTPRNTSPSFQAPGRHAYFKCMPISNHDSKMLNMKCSSYYRLDTSYCPHANGYITTHRHAGCNKLSARVLLRGLLARCKDCGSSTSVVNKVLYNIYGRCGWRQNVVFAHPFSPKNNFKNKIKNLPCFLTLWCTTAHNLLIVPNVIV